MIQLEAAYGGPSQSGFGSAVFQARSLVVMAARSAATSVKS
jgi:hypothetical protein